MAFKRFIREIRDLDFNFMKIISTNKSSLHDAKFQDKLLNPINNYNNSLNELLARLRQQDSPLSKTDIIIAIHQFNAQNENNLIKLLTDTSRSIWQNKANKDIQQELNVLLDELRAILKTARQFNKWSTTIIPVSSLEGKESLISRVTSETPSIRPLTYEESIELDHRAEYDKDLAKRGEAVSLPPRLQPERLDPKHRAWGTMFSHIRHTLYPIFNSWVEGNKSEDLTVELEFNDELRKRDEAFDPHVSRAVLEENADDERWYNSMNYYCTKREALDYLLTTKGNQLVQGVAAIPLDTNGDRFIYVMDMHGNLFVNKDGAFREGKRIGHPSFTGGAPVACAGDLIIREGKITYISNNSGHYQPGAFTLHRVVDELTNRGVLAEECTIDVVLEERGEEKFFSEIGGKRSSNLSLEQYNVIYEREMDNEVADNIDLSESSNPLALLNCLEKINHYLTTRAGETNCFLAFFNSYNGSDYYKRNNNFAELINLMHKPPHNTEQIINAINAALPDFNQGRRKNYANLLIELRDILVQNRTVLSHELVQETLGTYKEMNKALRKHATAHYNYQNKVSSSAGSDELGDIAATKTSYEFLRKKVAPELRSQFCKADKVEELQQYNARFQ